VNASMEFTERKLPREAVNRMRICPIRTVSPFALMLAPMYIFMRLNEKFISVKGPLDFFTKEELEHYHPFESFFVPEFVDSVLPFREAARRVRAILKWQTSAVWSEKEALPPAPYEVSDAVLRIIGPLWGDGAVIEPFFAAAFSNELCDLLPGDLLLQAREQNVDRYEEAILASGWAVFLALHLGYCDLIFLNQIRLAVFEQKVDGVLSEMPKSEPKSEVDELIALALTTMDGAFGNQPGAVAQKVASRLQRVSAEFIQEQTTVPTIFGPAGFIHG
jgi:hypothetical protein